jgi:hypothetical protein
LNVSVIVPGATVQGFMSGELAVSLKWVVVVSAWARAPIGVSRVDGGGAVVGSRLAVMVVVDAAAGAG